MGGEQEALARALDNERVQPLFCLEVEPYLDMLRTLGLDAAGVETAARKLMAS